MWIPLNGMAWLCFHCEKKPLKAIVSVGGIRLARTRIFNGNTLIGGDRPDKRNVAVLLTDGESNR